MVRSRWAYELDINLPVNQSLCFPGLCFDRLNGSKDFNSWNKGEHFSFHEVMRFFFSMRTKLVM